MDEIAYQSAIKLLYDRINYERSSHTPYTAQNYRLDRMRRLLDRLGNPHEKYAIVHIAGTKGKGTTANLIYDALRANGRKVGLYTSPHLLKVEERFQFDGRVCTPDQFVELVDIVMEAEAALDRRDFGRPTFFEITTAMGLLHFARSGADSVVLEVGLGGRLDSTNVCSPVLTIITSISLDHQAQLGSTIELIAGEKAGIIKPGIPVISTACHPDARRVIARVAEVNKSELLELDRDFQVQWTPKNLAPEMGDSVMSSSQDPNRGPTVAEVEYNRISRQPSFTLGSQPWPIRLLGRHQAKNLAGVITALNWLRTEANWNIDPSVTREALSQTQVPGRLQVVSNQPLKIIDTAHNPASVAAAVQALDDHFGSKPRVVVFASSRDKDYTNMLGQLISQSDHLICTAFQKNPRAVLPADLYAAATQVAARQNDSTNGNTKDGRVAKIHIVENPHEAWKVAEQIGDANSLILSIGSFFLAAELLETTTSN